MSSRETSGSKVDDFFVTNVTLFSQNLIKGLSASFSVYNSLTRNNRDPAGTGITQKFVEPDGRNVRFKGDICFLIVKKNEIRSD